MSTGVSRTFLSFPGAYPRQALLQILSYVTTKHPRQPAFGSIDGLPVSQGSEASHLPLSSLTLFVLENVFSHNFYFC